MLPMGLHAQGRARAFFKGALRQPPLQARRPCIPDRARNLAMTSYADDVARKIICGSFSQLS
eukprot:2995596-Pyramimonas_sp.AAC.1